MLPFAPAQVGVADVLVIAKQKGVASTRIPQIGKGSELECRNSAGKWIVGIIGPGNFQGVQPKVLVDVQVLRVDALPSVSRVHV